LVYTAIGEVSYLRKTKIKRSHVDSDIRAELDKLPPSLIWGYEDSLRLPDRLLGAVGSQSMEYLELQNEKLSVRDVMFHYHAQISIRRTLNRAHAALYSVEGWLFLACFRTNI